MCVSARTCSPITTLAAGLIAATALLAACHAPATRIGDAPVPAPASMQPADSSIVASPGAPSTQQPIDLSAPGAAVRRVAAAERFDTRLHPVVTTQPIHEGPTRRVKEILPPHERPSPLPAGMPNSLPVGGLLDQPRANPRTLWAGIGQTGWTPPDPTIAIGPSHVLATVNMSIAWYTKSGTLQYYNDLSNAGNPGFFETVGAGGFTFDPKCFYDHYAGRFVVVAPEVYGSTEAWITIAVSDDSDPNGVWYKYRTDAVIDVGGQTFWWDYPGFGYDQNGYYVTSNLFGLNQGGWGGVGFRVFNKAPMLSGQPVEFWTLRDGGSASAQVAQCFGSPGTPFVVSFASQSAMRLHAITNPLTNPQLAIVDVPIPVWAGSFGAPSAGGNTIDTLDNRMINACWRDGRLYATHGISGPTPTGNKNLARWYQLKTNGWPLSGQLPVYEQGGNVDMGSDVHTFFPAIYANRFGEIGMVVGHSSPSTRMSVGVTGRKPGDAPGTMGAVTTVRVSGVNGGGRIGDYYDIAVDPADDRTFWVVGEHFESFGWANWITSFAVTSGSAPYAVWDQIAANLFDGQSAVVDALANDYHTGGLPLVIDSFQATSAHGGAVARSVGTGPGGRDELIYTAPAGYTGQDTVTYTIRDTQGATSSNVIYANVFDTGAFRNPDLPEYTTAGVRASYYVVTGASVLPDFSTLTPYAAESIATIDIPSTGGVFGGSGRADEVGAVYEGYVLVPQTDVYTLYTSSDDGSRLYVGDTLIVNNDGLHGMQEIGGSIGLKAGLHRLRIEFFENGGGAGLVVSVAGGGLAKQTIPASMWFRDLTGPFREPDVVGGTSAGLNARYYVTTIFNTALPDFDALTPYLTTFVSNLNYPATSGAFANSTRADGVGAVFEGYFLAPDLDEYKFFLNSDEGSRLRIGGSTVVNNDGVHTMKEVSGTIGLKPGLHAIRVEYFERLSAAGLIFSVESGGLAKQAIPVSMLRRVTSCPADFDGTGFVDTDDFDAFIVAFEAGDTTADFDGTGFVDTDDFDAFVVAFETGC
ncbi:MAG: hypothetical protein AMXMBFR58_21640 [Phycisphaerae bacterium]